MRVIPTQPGAHQEMFQGNHLSTFQQHAALMPRAADLSCDYGANLIYSIGKWDAWTFISLPESSAAASIKVSVIAIMSICSRNHDTSLFSFSLCALELKMSWEKLLSAGRFNRSPNTRTRRRDEYLTEWLHTVSQCESVVTAAAFTFLCARVCV